MAKMLNRYMHLLAFVLFLTLASAALKKSGKKASKSSASIQPVSTGAASSSGNDAGVYDRPLDFVYAFEKGQPLKYSDDDFLKYFAQADATSLVSFFLNVGDLSKYQPFIDKVEQKFPDMAIIPAVGGGGQDDLNSEKYQNIAKVYRGFTDYIRIEVGVNNNLDQINGIVDHCVDLGFKHIMMNPWPTAPGGGAVKFSHPEVDSAYIQVLLNEDSNFNVSPDPENWYPGNQKKIDAIRAILPNADILINYESEPQQAALTKIEQGKKGASTDAMGVTLDQINGQFKGKNLRWAPPFDKAYDPIASGTWEWIADKLKPCL